MKSTDIKFELNDIVVATESGWAHTRISPKHIRLMNKGEEGKVIDVDGEDITVLCNDGNKIGRTANYLKLIKKQEQDYEIY